MRNRLLTLLSGSNKRTVTIPRYMLSDPGSVAEGFESAAQWSVSEGTATNNTTAGQFVQGTQSVKFTGTVTQQRSYKYPFGPVDVTNLERLYCNIFHHNAFKHASLRMYGNHDHLSYIDMGITQKQGSMPVGVMSLGRAAKRDMTAVGMTFATPIVEARVTYDQGGANAISLDNLILNAKGFGAGVILCFDDGYSSAYNLAYPLLASYNIRANIALISSFPGGGAQYISWEQLQALDAAGWCVINHGDSNDPMAGQNLATQMARIQTCDAALHAHNLEKGRTYLAFYSGSYDATSLTAMTNTGMVLGRMVGDALGTVNYLPFHALKEIPSMTINSTKSVQYAKDYLDLAIQDKAVAVYHLHNLGSAGEWTLAQLTEFVDYIVTKSRAGLLYPLTFDDYYKLHLGSIQIPMVK